MRRGYLGAAAVLAVIALVGAAAAAYALSMQQAEQMFKQHGCTNCHNGGLAPDFQGTVKTIEEWAKKYKSLDAAVAAESKNFKMFKGVKTWNQLMSQMPGITPELKQFFEQVFEQAKKGGTAPAATTAKTGASPKTVTVTQVRTVTVTMTEKTIITETVTPANVVPGTGKLVAKAAYVAAILVAIAAVVLAYMYMGRK